MSNDMTLTTFTSMDEMIAHVRALDVEEFDHMKSVYSEAKFLSWVVEQASYPRFEDGSHGWFEDPAEAFEHVLPIARIAKSAVPELTLQSCMFEFWVSPWAFETEDAVIYAMFRGATYLECDEFAVDETDEATVDGYRELIRWGKEAGATDELIGDYAESLFRRNHTLASKLGFGGCFEPEKEWESAES